MTMLGLTTASQATELRISTLLPDGTAEVRALRQASETISAETEGRVSLRLYPGGIMGDDQAVTRRIRAGQLHGALVQTGALTEQFRNSQILNAPFVFNDYDEVEHVRSIFEPDIAEGLRQQGIHTFGFIDGGFAYIMSQQPVRSVNDLQQTRLWLPANDNFSLQVARSFNISPTILNISEVLTSLQTGVVNAIASPPNAALTLQWFTRVNYVTDMPLIYTYATLYLHQRHLSRLSEADQAVVDRVLRQTTAQMDVNNRANSQAAFDALINQGLEKISLTDEEISVVRNNAQEAHRQLIQQGEFSQEWLDRLLGSLAEYRQTQ
ncbi:MAG: TRAP transporter substrate-binding protein DctP [Natronospirillum sp.]